MTARHEGMRTERQPVKRQPTEPLLYPTEFDHSLPRRLRGCVSREHSFRVVVDSTPFPTKGLKALKSIPLEKGSSCVDVLPV